MLERAASVSVEKVSLSAEQADAVQQIHSTVAALEASLHCLREIGSLRGAQCIEEEKKRDKETAIDGQAVTRSRGRFLAETKGSRAAPSHAEAPFGTSRASARVQHLRQS